MARDWDAEEKPAIWSFPWRHERRARRRCVTDASSFPTAAVHFAVGQLLPGLLGSGLSNRSTKLTALSFAVLGATTLYVM